MKHAVAKRIGIVGVLLLSLAILAGCSVQAPQATATPEVTAAAVATTTATATQAATAVATQAPTATATATATPVATETAKTFNATELAKFNGQNGNPAYVAVNGTVYDVTNVPEWKNGSHFGRFQAGADLSDAIKLSPHGVGKLDGVPVVGKYVP